MNQEVLKERIEKTLSTCLTGNIYAINLYKTEATEKLLALFSEHTAVMERESRIDELEKLYPLKTTEIHVEINTHIPELTALNSKEKE